jgi:methionyl-tRNA formyltransferase
VKGKAAEWWTKPRQVSVVVDNDSWGLAWAERLVDQCNEDGDTAALIRSQKDVPDGDLAFYLNCLNIASPDVLRRNRRNLVVHASDLPRGRGFSPLTWMTLEGLNKIPICLLEAAEEADAGPIIFKDWMQFEGHELIDEMRTAIGEKTLELAKRYLDETRPPEGSPQAGDSSFYTRRKPSDSEIDPQRSIAEQFEMFRVADNQNYPVFFRHRGKTYELAIAKAEDGS